MNHMMLNAAEAAEYLHITLAELERLRESYGGPPCVRLEGKFYYSRENLDGYRERQCQSIK